MRRLNIPAIRARCWKLLKNPKTTIRLGTYKHQMAGSDTRIEGDEESGLIINVDPIKTDIASAVVHELMHWVLDPIYIRHVVYDVYERWITALEKPFFNTLSEKEKKRWHNAIIKKLPKSNRPKPLGE